LREISRPSRASVTDKIQKKLLELLKQEKDFYKKKVHAAKWYRDEVGKALSLAEENNPLLRSYEIHIRRLKRKLQARDPLDEPWMIGSCEKNGISDFAIPMLIEFQNICNDLNKDLKFPEVWKWELSVRKAKWMARLFPSVDAIAEKYFAEQTTRKIMVLSSIADIYSREEFNVGIIGKSGNSTFNTYEIDKFVFYEPHTTWDEWWNNIIQADYVFKAALERAKMTKEILGWEPSVLDGEMKIEQRENTQEEQL
jgi:hypothetical protein